MFYNIEIMTFELAEKISQWTYENEYSIYSFDKSEGTLKELLSGDYFSCLDQEGRLIGYFCKGYSANIPTVEDYDYNDGILDIGLGLRPDLCGKGMGYDFMFCGMKLIKKMYGDIPMRLTVACFNLRAISLYQKFGFSIKTIVTHQKSLDNFFIMMQ